MMATSAFKSTTKRAPIGTPSCSDDSGSSSKAYRRSRSLSRLSRLLPESPADDFGDAPVQKGRFVNTVRGSGFPEISLDDLAIEFFPHQCSLEEKDGSERGRSSRRGSDVRPPTTTSASYQRRGRSVSRQNSRADDVKRSVNNGSAGGRPVADANSRRRRSVSVVRYQISDSESDLDHSQNSGNHADTKSLKNGNKHMPLSPKSTAPSSRGLRRSHSQKDILKSHDGYSTQSSAITDDEASVSHCGKNGNEKTIRTVYSQKAEHPTGDDMNYGLYEAMRKELRFAVEEIKKAMGNSALGRGDGLQRDDSDVFQAVSAIRKNYATKLEQSEKRKQDLLAEIVLEDQRGRELSNIVKELLPESKSLADVKKPVRARKRSNDRNKMSKQLTEEAEKYFEDFLSNVEDTDISSFDGERSDGSSALGTIVKPRDFREEKETHQSPAGANSLPVGMDGVILPWLEWETSNDGSSLLGKNKRQSPSAPKASLWDAGQDMASAHDPSSYSASSRGSWSPVLVNNHSITDEDSRSKSTEQGSYQRSKFDMDEYLKLQSDEELLLERWRQRHRINSGGLLLCSNFLR